MKWLARSAKPRAISSATGNRAEITGVPFPGRPLLRNVCQGPVERLEQPYAASAPAVYGGGDKADLR